MFLTFASLFLSILLLQFSQGALSPMDALFGLGQGFTNSEVGFLGSAHFIGFVYGCWWAPRLLGRVGHARAFAAFIATGAIGIAAHVLAQDALWWALFRVAGGICVAGAYTVVEAWLQAKVTNETRGTAMGVYRIVDISGSFFAQFIVGALTDLPTYVAYNVLTIILCLSILPFGLTTSPQPATPPATKLKPLMAWEKSPLAAVGVITSALIAASYRMVGPVYGNEIGLNHDQIGYFLAAYVAGGALAQLPVGRIADRFDRRHVLIGLSVATVGASALVIFAALIGPAASIAASALFGATTFPIYSVSSAHAHDFAVTEERVELSAALMFAYAVGAIAAPWGASTLIDQFGPWALFGMIMVGNAGLALFGLARMRARPAERRTRYTYAPRTSFLVGFITRRDRESDKD